MGEAARASDQPARLALLRALAVMDGPPEPAFTRVVSLVSACLGMPMALLSFLDEDRVWFAAKVGVDSDVDADVDVKE
nr:hypothetical protein [Sporichthyaceae bacterium]